MNCIIITSEFPYLNAESFLENEIDYLCSTFDNVYIFSINAKSKDSITRCLPSNAKCFPLGGNSTKMRYFLYLIKGLNKYSDDLSIKTRKLSEILFSLYVRGRSVDTAKKILYILKKEDFLLEKVVIYSYWFTYHSIAAWIIGEKLRINHSNVFTVTRAHGYDLYDYRNRFGYLPYQEVTIKNLNGVFPCSINGTKYLRDKYPNLSNKIHTAYLGTNDYGLGLEKGDEFSSEKEWVLMTCCICKPLKRLPMFAEAFVKLCKDVNAKWICVGDGPDLSAVKKIVIDNGISNRVHFVGMISNLELMDIYKSTHISYFCNVSTVEGLPVSIMEAFSFGIPVIATNVGGTSELVSESVGRIIEPDLNSDILYEVLKEETSIIEEAYTKKRIAARQKWMITVSAEKNYTDWCDLLTTNCGE